MKKMAWILAVPVFLSVWSACDDPEIPKSAEAHLSDVILTSVSDAVPVYSFVSNTMSYTVKILYTTNDAVVTGVTVTPIACDPNGTIRIRSILGDMTNWTIVASGYGIDIPFVPVSTEQYGNTVEIRSTAEDNQTALTYIFTILRNTAN